VEDISNEGQRIEHRRAAGVEFVKTFATVTSIGLPLNVFPPILIAPSTRIVTTGHDSQLAGQLKKSKKGHPSPGWPFLAPLTLLSKNQADYRF
jgi:hypothetical protein